MICKYLVTLSILISNAVTASCVWDTLDGNPTKLLGHRGEKAFMPEHSLGSYHMAAFESADYIEPDVVASKDGELVIMHSEWMSDTTNVASIPKFADRKRNFFFNGTYAKINRTDFWIFDFTFAELQEIKLVQENFFPYRPQYFNNDFTILSVDNYLDLIANLTNTMNRTFGIVPELKSPEVFNWLNPSPNGRWFEDKLLGILEKRGFFANQPPASDPLMVGGDLLNEVMNIKPANYKAPNYKRAVIQSFDPDTCKYLASKTKIPIVYLDQRTPTTYTPKGLDIVAKFSNILSMGKEIMLDGPENYFTNEKIAFNKTQIAEMGGFLNPEQLVAEAHKRGIRLSPYTFNDSRQKLNYYCNRGLNPNATFCPTNRKEELFYFFNLGTDYMFVENIFEAQVLRLAYDYKVRYGVDA
ncbi:Glycerophosphodiester phosphodiesterase GDPD5 [Smittium mucronatum]|uniref:glycerophosphodiester phosphodiesterase n=1 Tax=Smittium mucronatum TaxID=133383 RepID=A0A1R0H063_9FUNG|nr:Glycerophosphodiester phosphodiesterase GDPD5 [Smittium mucronatum]